MPRGLPSNKKINHEPRTFSTANSALLQEDFFSLTDYEQLDHNSPSVNDKMLL